MTGERHLGPVLITGATGFVGRATVETLASAGYPFRRAVRKPDQAPDKTAFVVGDIGPETDWSDALVGVDCVVHLAARTHVVRETHESPTEEFERVNVAGTERLARAAIEAGARRFVYLSSATVNGPHNTDGPFTESDEPRPATDYARSKLKSEKALMKLVEGSEMEAVILRPPLVYGPGVKANFLSLMKLAQSGVPLPLASVDNRRSLISVRNLSDAILTCIEHPKAANETFLVSDAEDVSTPELIRRIAHALGEPARLFPCPSALLRAVGRAIGKEERLGKLMDSLAVDTSKIRRELGWEPPYSMSDELRETAEWFVDRSN